MNLSFELSPKKILGIAFALLAVLLACTYRMGASPSDVALSGVILASVGLAVLALVTKIDVVVEVLRDELEPKTGTGAGCTYSYAGAGSPEPKDDPQARQRAELEHVLVQGASHALSNAPSRAGELAKGIKNFMATLHGTPDTTLPVIDPGPDSLEREIQAKANKAPRVTPAALQAEIVSAHYFTAADGALGAYRAGGDVHPVGGTPSQAAHLTLSLLTICVLVLRNGFTVVGYSACASPANFNKEIGQRIARENAEREIWPLLGFRLRDELARPVLTEADAAADLAGVPRPA